MAVELKRLFSDEISLSIYLYEYANPALRANKGICSSIERYTLETVCKHPDYLESVLFHTCVYTICVLLSLVYTIVYSHFNTPSETSNNNNKLGQLSFYSDISMRPTMVFVCVCLRAVHTLDASCLHLPSRQHKIGQKSAFKFDVNKP